MSAISSLLPRLNPLCSHLREFHWVKVSWVIGFVEFCLDRINKIYWIDWIFIPFITFRTKVVRLNPPAAEGA
jgi:uncharacterized protein YqcC (DUF446 family)